MCAPSRISLLLYQQANSSLRSPKTRSARGAKLHGVQCRALSGLDTVKYVTKMAATIQNQLENAVNEARVPWTGESFADSGAAVPAKRYEVQ